MSNMPNDIRNMWEQAAGYSPIRGMPSLGDDPVSKMKRNASTQQRPLTDQEHAAIARHAENAANAAKKNAGKGKNGL